MPAPLLPVLVVVKPVPPLPLPPPVCVTPFDAANVGNSAAPDCRASASACSSCPIAAAIEKFATSVSSMKRVSSGERNCVHQSTAWSNSRPSGAP